MCVFPTKVFASFVFISSAIKDPEMMFLVTLTVLHSESYLNGSFNTKGNDVQVFAFTE